MPTYTYDFRNRKIANPHLIALGGSPQKAHIGHFSKNQPKMHQVKKSQSTETTVSKIYDLTQKSHQPMYRGNYVDELIAIIPAEGISDVLYAHQDRQYNLRGLTNANGDLVEYYAYSPYGERTAYDANGTEIDQNSVELKTEYGFTGRRYDMESDLW